MLVTRRKIVRGNGAHALVWFFGRLLDRNVSLPYGIGTRTCGLTFGGPRFTETQLSNLGIKYVTIRSSDTQEERTEKISEFNNLDNDTMVLLVTNALGSVSINLQQGSSWSSSRSQLHSISWSRSWVESIVSVRKRDSASSFLGLGLGGLSKLPLQLCTPKI